MKNEIRKITAEEMEVVAGGKNSNPDRPPEYYAYRDYVRSLFKKYNVSMGKWNELNKLLTKEESAKVAELLKLYGDAEARWKAEGRI